MSDAGYKRWMGAEWWSEGYEQLWLRPHESQGHQASGENITPTNKDRSPSPNPLSLSGRTNKERKLPANAAQDSVVYLTADSEQELLELKPDETYVIGGICDHNRYKVDPRFLKSISF
jgi:tRNA (guanine9-N1)-methyltransferase